MAAILTYADVVLGDWKLTFEQVKEIQSITADDVKRVANEYLVKKSRTVGEIVYAKSKKGGGK